jgi:hypothetical protein
MSRRIQAFKQCDVAKAIKAVLKSGLNVERLELDGGKITVIAGKAPVNQADIVGPEGVAA